MNTQQISQNKKHSTLKEFISFLLIIIFALSVRIFIMEPYYVPTGSMKETILEKEYVFSTKYSYGYSKYSFTIPLINYKITANLANFDGRIFTSNPNRGDVIIFRPPFDMERLYIKRLIGLPGDKIQIINDVIYINNHPVNRLSIKDIKDENGTVVKQYKETLPNNVSYYSYKLTTSGGHKSNTDIFYVPQDHYFFMGDNRDNSNDSRFDLGYVPFENLVAKARFIFFSTQETLFPEQFSDMFTDFNITSMFNRIFNWVGSIRTDRFLHKFQL